jgi:hypothetical protein
VQLQYNLRHSSRTTGSMVMVTLPVEYMVMKISYYFCDYNFEVLAKASSLYRTGKSGTKSQSGSR